MTTLRDQGNKVYLGDRVIDRTAANSSQYAAGSGSDTAPTTDAHGFELDGWNDFLLSMVVDGAVTDYQWILRFYDGRHWQVIEDSSTLAAADFDPTANYHRNYYAVNWSRGHLQMINCTNGNGIDIVGSRAI